ncbi:protein PEP-RELATED DEVELOPMENT ARRESTED 1, chloroplastic isoform X2 [Brassica rapa]|nr:protein PEP-RELATED DEVELOPMENT ARRESTED 1, chloroplastic isoform X2 [Brassica rapa]
METRPVVPDRILLARLVSRNMMGGGILDERNDRGFSTLPESEVLLLCPSHHVYELAALSLKQVNFLTKLVALKPGKSVQQMTQNVMQGKDEGADDLSNREDSSTQGRRQSGLNGRGSVTGRKPLPVRPGMFLETVTKVMGSIYSGNACTTSRMGEFLKKHQIFAYRVYFLCVH